MSVAQNSSLFQQYSSAFTRLQQGKQELAEFGADRVLLNRYILDSANTTNPSDPGPVLKSINNGKVNKGDSTEERQQYCESSLAGLVKLQEEVNTLQKVAREKGISAGLLTIVGQASVQSPDDNGASVIKNLNALLNPDDKSAVPHQVTGVASESEVALQAAVSGSETAANDSMSMDFERLTTLQKFTTIINEHKTALAVDLAFCFAASCFAINLVS